MDKGTWQATVPGVTEPDTTEHACQRMEVVNSVQFMLEM